MRRNRGLQTEVFDPYEGWMTTGHVLSHLETDLRAMEDRRRFRFDRLAAPAAVRRSDRRLVLKGSVGEPSKSIGRLSFAVPERVVMCVRRKIRRQVMFAYGHGGKGGRKRSHRRNFWSAIGC